MLEVPLKTDVVATICSLLSLLFGWSIDKISQMIHLPLHFTRCRDDTSRKFLVHHHYTRLVCDNHIWRARDLFGFHRPILRIGNDFSRATSLLKLLRFRGCLLHEVSCGLKHWPRWGYTSSYYGTPWSQALLPLNRWVVYTDRSVLRIRYIPMKSTTKCVSVCLLSLCKLRTVIGYLRDRDQWRHLEIDPLALLNAAQLNAGNRYGAEFRPNTSLIRVLRLLWLNLTLIL